MLRRCVPHTRAPPQNTCTPTQKRTHTHGPERTRGAKKRTGAKKERPSDWHVQGASARIARSVVFVRQGVIWHGARYGRFLTLHCIKQPPSHRATGARRPDEWGGAVSRAKGASPCRAGALASGPRMPGPGERAQRYSHTASQKTEAFLLHAVGSLCEEVQVHVPVGVGVASYGAFSRPSGRAILMLRAGMRCSWCSW